MDGDNTKSSVDCVSSDAKIQKHEKGGNESVSNDNHVTNQLIVNVDISNPVITTNAPITFLNLNRDIKRIILKKLDLCSRYNLILVWEDMAEEFWHSVDVKKNWISITTTEDFELAGVLASAGYLETVKELNIKGFDFSSYPVNIINNLIKIVTKRIVFEKVTGFYPQLLGGVNCQSLCLKNMKILKLNKCSHQKGQNMKIEALHLQNVRGHLNNLFDNFERFYELGLKKLNSSLLNNLNMPEIFENKIKCLRMGSLLPEWLNQYDGRGKCEEILITHGFNRYYVSWAIARGWKMWKDPYYGFRLYRPQ